MKVMALKLIGGEEIIGHEVLIDDIFVNILQPVVMQHVRHPSTSEMIQGFGDWPGLAEPSCEPRRIRLSAVAVMPLPAHEELARQYISNVTGLDLPQATTKILLG